MKQNMLVGNILPDKTWKQSANQNIDNICIYLKPELECYVSKEESTDKGLNFMAYNIGCDFQLTPV